jgi:hypothetical protein
MRVCNLQANVISIAGLARYEVNRIQAGHFASAFFFGGASYETNGITYGD